MKAASVAVAGWVFVLVGGLVAQDQGSVAVSTSEPDSTMITPSRVQVYPADPPPAEIAGNDGAGPGDSHVRIVRLSQARGHVGLDRATGKVEATMTNMPIVERSRLATGDDGYAEVEFEDGSTVRLPPDSQVNFPQLILRGTGAKASTITLAEGTTYINLEKTKDMEFTVKAGDAVMTVQPGTHLRLEEDGKKVVLAVFKGNVEMKSGSTSASVGKNRTATLDSSSTGPEAKGTEAKIQVDKDIDETAYDEWDQDLMDYHQRYSKANAYGSSLYSYGIPDMNYYGGFMNAGGCGSFWRPYLASAAWDPYANGVWAWYQGAGYSWVSPYPWGWLPYHSGAWSFCPGVGWGWRPGGAWLGLANWNPVMRPIPSKPGQPGQGVARGGVPVRPPGPQRPTGVPHSTLLLANRAPLVYSKIDRPGNFVFEKDSAGLGVPRGAMGNLHGISSHVERSGFVSRQVYGQPMPSPGAAADRGSAMAMRPGAANSSAHENHSWSFRENHQPGMNAQSFHHGPDGQGSAFHGDRGGNAAAGAFHPSGGSGSTGGFHGGSPSATSAGGGSSHSGGGGSMGSAGAASSSGGGRSK